MFDTEINNTIITLENSKDKLEQDKQSNYVEDLRNNDFNVLITNENIIENQN